MTTTVHLSPELAQFVDQKVRSGEFPNIDAVVNEALREKAERDAACHSRVEVHVRQIRQLRCGE